MEQRWLYIHLHGATVRVQVNSEEQEKQFCELLNVGLDLQANKATQIITITDQYASGKPRIIRFQSHAIAAYELVSAAPSQVINPVFDKEYRDAVVDFMRRAKNEAERGDEWRQDS